MIYDCDPADTISALRAANEDLSEQVCYWKGLANKPDGTFQFQLRTAKSELEIAYAEINRLNGVIEKYRQASKPQSDLLKRVASAWNITLTEPTENWDMQPPINERYTQYVLTDSERSELRAAIILEPKP